MRVIAGKYRSRRLHTLRGIALRPSSDRLRETLFNILGTLVEDAVFLDLFAGSGAVGIEALSRGARHAIFVESHPAGAALLQRNLRSLDIAIHENSLFGGKMSGGKVAGSNMHRSKEFAGTAEILTRDVLAAIERLADRGTRADLVFADPPYDDSDAYDSALDLLGDSDVLSRSALVVFEHHHKRQLPAFAGQLERTRVVKQGDATLSFYRVVLAA
jgi:16S rRNA (guanine(966)-N(2))-methyltransferase RsmD